MIGLVQNDTRMLRRRMMWPLVAMMALLLAPVAAWSQTAPPSVASASPASSSPAAPALAPSTQSPATAPEPPSANPGLVEELGRLLKDSASGISSSLKGSQQTIDNLQNRAKDAAGNLRLSPQTVVNGRANCPVAANGAPDCKAAANHLCKGRGYKEGKSLDVESAEKCPAKVYLSGRTGVPGECKTENYVTRAICQ